MLLLNMPFFGYHGIVMDRFIRKDDFGNQACSTGPDHADGAASVTYL